MRPKPPTLARRHTTEHGIVGVELGIVGGIKEPLTRGAVRVAGSRHRECSTEVASAWLQYDWRVGYNCGNRIGCWKKESPTLHDLDRIRVVGCAAMDEWPVVSSRVHILQEICDGHGHGLIEQLDIESSEIGGESDERRALQKWTGQQGNDDPKIAEYV